MLQALPRSPLFSARSLFGQAAFFLLLLLLAIQAFAGQATLAWDASTDPEVTGYRLHYGQVSQSYTSTIDVGSQTTHTVPNLTEGKTYYYAATAYDASGRESGYSNEASAAVAYAAPTADFKASVTSGSAPLAVAFTSTTSGTVSAYSWNFGDGTSSTAANPNHSYGAAGTYSVSLTVTGANGTTKTQATKPNYVTVTAPPPVANFAADKTSGLAPLAVNFTSTSTGTVSGYSWKFGDGGSSTSPNPSHTFAAAGTYTISLTATGPTGTHTQTKANYIAVSVPPPAPSTTPPPVANFTANTTRGVAPLTVNFASTSSGTINSYAWNFGDGTTSTLQNPAHSYAQAGTFPVTLSVTGPGGSNSLNKPAYITVSPAAVTTPTQQSLWSASAKPANANDPDTSPVNLGVKFTSSQNGFIQGIRFYKSPYNTGTHVGALWSGTGQLLAQATFTGETASGWQQVNFATPVPITANTVYVASYLAPRGHYANDDGYFANTGVTSGPLTALRNGVSGSNGVYAYATGTAFPTSSYRATNYWVDVVFTPTK